MLHGILVNPAPVTAFRGGGGGVPFHPSFYRNETPSNAPVELQSKFLPANLHSRKLHHFPGANLILNWSLG
jgi:hypothetical protein